MNCAATVRDGFRQYPCSVSATRERDGKNYCGIHDPEKVKARREANSQKMRERWDYEKKCREERVASDFLAECERRSGITVSKMLSNVVGHHCAAAHHLELILNGERKP